MKKNILFILIFLTFSCKLTPITKISGIQNLDEKLKSIEIGKSNKNDVREVLGYSVVFEPANENIWYYMEIQESRNFFGKKIIIKNLFVVLEFDNKSILLKKEIYTPGDIDKDIFAKEITESKTIDKNFIKDFLNSTRKRMQSSKKSKN